MASMTTRSVRQRREMSTKVFLSENEFDRIDAAPETNGRSSPASTETAMPADFIAKTRSGGEPNRQFEDNGYRGSESAAQRAGPGAHAQCVGSAESALAGGLVKALRALSLRALSIALLQLLPGLSFGAIQLTPIVSGGLANPTFVTHAGDGSNRLFITELAGIVKVLQSGATVPARPRNGRNFVRIGDDQP
jgi:hypothetical protein